MNQRSDTIMCNYHGALCRATLGLFALGAMGAADARGPVRHRLDDRSFGPLTIGMSESAVRKAIGARVTSDGGIGDPRVCHHLTSPKLPRNLVVMLRQGRVTRFSIYQGPSPVRTALGVGLGSSAADLRRAYGNVFETGSDAGGSPFRVYWKRGSGRGIRFDLDEHDRVRGMHAGDRSIWLSEGCA